MLAKLYEILIFLGFSIPALYLLITKVYSAYNEWKYNFDFMDRFLDLKKLVFFITESNNFTYQICNLNPTLFTIDNTTFLNIVSELGINKPVSILIDGNNYTNLLGYYLSGTTYIEIRRVCFYNGSLYLLKFRIIS